MDNVGAAPDQGRRKSAGMHEKGEPRPACDVCTHQCHTVHGGGTAGPPPREPAAGRRSCPYFIKTVMKGCLHDAVTSSICIPVAFVESYPETFQPNTVMTLEGPSGNQWAVRAHKSSPCITTGWRAFAHDHGLREGDQLHFTLTKPCHFVVEIFNSHGGVRKSAQRATKTGKYATAPAYIPILAPESRKRKARDGGVDHISDGFHHGISDGYGDPAAPRRCKAITSRTGRYSHDFAVGHAGLASNFADRSCKQWECHKEVDGREVVTILDSDGDGDGEERELKVHVADRDMELSFGSAHVRKYRSSSKLERLMEYMKKEDRYAHHEKLKQKLHHHHKVKVQEHQGIGAATVERPHEAHDEEDEVDEGVEDADEERREDGSDGQTLLEGMDDPLRSFTRMFDTCRPRRKSKKAQPKRLQLGPIVHEPAGASKLGSSIGAKTDSSGRLMTTVLKEEETEPAEPMWQAAQGHESREKTKVGEDEGEASHLVTQAHVELEKDTALKSTGGSDVGSCDERALHKSAQLAQQIENSAARLIRPKSGGDGTSKQGAGLTQPLETQESHKVESCPTLLNVEAGHLTSEEGDGAMQPWHQRGAQVLDKSGSEIEKEMVPTRLLEGPQERSSVIAEGSKERVSTTSSQEESLQVWAPTRDKELCGDESAEVALCTGNAICAAPEVLSAPTTERQFETKESMQVMCEDFSLHKEEGNQASNSVYPSEQPAVTPEPGMYHHALDALHVAIQKEEHLLQPDSCKPTSEAAVQNKDVMSIADTDQGAELGSLVVILERPACKEPEPQIPQGNGKHVKEPGSSTPATHPVHKPVESESTQHTESELKEKQLQCPTQQPAETHGNKNTLNGMTSCLPLPVEEESPEKGPDHADPYAFHCGEEDMKGIMAPKSISPRRLKKFVRSMKALDRQSWTETHKIHCQEPAVMHTAPISRDPQNPQEGLSTRMTPAETGQKAHAGIPIARGHAITVGEANQLQSACREMSPGVGYGGHGHASSGTEAQGSAVMQVERQETPKTGQAWAKNTPQSQLCCFSCHRKL